MKTMAWGIAACLLVAGCATTPKEKPLLTNRALARAAAKCHVRSLGVHYSRNGKLPYGQFLVPPEEREAEPDKRPSTQCMFDALEGYRRDYLGLVDTDPAARSPQ